MEFNDPGAARSGYFLAEIHRLMDLRGVTARDVALIAGVPPAAISGTEPATVYVPLRKLPLVACALGVHPAPLGRLWVADHADWMKELMEPPFSPFGEPFEREESAIRDGPRCQVQSGSAPSIDGG